MPFDPNRHRRRSIRLRGYDYRGAGIYFVTLCTASRACLFGDVVDDEMRLHPIGAIVREEWLRTPELRPSVELDEYVVMPNHVHGLLVINDAGPMRASTETRPVKGLMPGSVGAIVGQFKSVTTKRVRREFGQAGRRLWQRNYFERIVRDEEALDRIRRYIIANPANWAKDPENPANPGSGIS